MVFYSNKLYVNLEMRDKIYISYFRSIISKPNIYIWE